MPVYHSEQRHFDTVRKRWPDPLIALHPETAAALDIGEGDWVDVVTPMGKIRMRLRLSGAVDPRMADAQHGWWFPEKPGTEPVLFGVFDSNANMVCPDDPEFCSPEIGSWPHTGLLCRIEKGKGQ
jgi:thiosulfate reductase/polysulfide reductase chain A